MSSLGHHVRIRLESDRMLHTSAAHRRTIARSVYRISEPWPLLAFGCAGVHLHLVVLADHADAGELARRLEIGLQRSLGFGVPFLKVHRKELADQQHLRQAVLYDIGQRKHHDLASDPYLEATSAPDLLGARMIGGFLLSRIREHVPELRHRDVLAAFGLPGLSGPEVETNPDRIREAVLSAAAIPSLQGATPEAQAARVATVALAGPTISSADLAKSLETSRRSIQRLRSARPSSALLRAASIQLALRQQADKLAEGATPLP
ncbi:MAG: hypothetical protein ABIO70_20270 [Pseudomonadota bacterium]